MAVTVGVASPAAWAWHAGMPVVWAWVWKQAACARRAGAGREWRGDGVEGPRRVGRGGRGRRRRPAEAASRADKSTEAGPAES